jgi:16S rRNA (adenine1518-N6/adenine1519-N6)-dimethyltransferase
VLDREIGYADVAAEDTVLEIGAGTGNLTAGLAARARRVVAVECDRQFAACLDRLADEHGNVAILWGDARTVPFPPFDRVVANLPYRVALPIIFRLLDYPFGCAVLILQQDMAQHLCAGAGQAGYGRLSVTVQRLALAELLDTVPRQAFSPPPEVASAMVRLRPIAAPFPVGSDAAFRQLLDYLFLHRDDRLASALQRLGDARAAVPALPRRLRDRPVAQLTPAEFGEISRFLDSRGVRLPKVSDSVKRRAQQRRLRPG